MSMIQVKNLKKKYTRGKEVITDLNLEFGEVGLNIVAGKSGCGKTTLINILGGMDLDYSGEVLVDGQNIREFKYDQIADYRNFTSAFVFQKNSLFEFLTVEDNLKLCLNIQNNDSKENNNVLISDALKRVGLEGFEKKYVRALSGGEKQRVAIARCLIKDAKIVFADEPTSALDSKNAHKIFQLFKELATDRLVIVVTHDVKKASMYADRVIKLIDGNIEEDILYKDRSNEQARELKARETKKLALGPIFKHNLKTGLIINLFVMILLIIGICITNIAIEQKKIKDEYDKFGTSEEFFNIDRAIQTQIDNNINMFKVVKRGNATDPYYYIQNAVTDYDYDLSIGDYAFIKSNFSSYSLYEGTNDIRFEKLLIEGISERKRMSVTVDNTPRYWYTYLPTNFNYYVYDKNNDYNLVAGRLPKASNEILVTDTVADMYLRKRAYDPGIEYMPFYNDYVVNYDDLLNPTYTLAYSEYGAGKNGALEGDLVEVENKFIVYDTYGKYEGTLGGTATYYLYDEIEYKVVGIIDTGLLDYYTYNYDSYRYYLLSNFVTQSGNEEFMNSLKYQPGGYIVLPEALKGTNAKQNLQDNCTIQGVYANGVKASNTISAFFGEYDYTGYGLAGKDEDLNNSGGRILAKSTTDSKLKDDEVIISVTLANKLFPDINMTINTANRKYASIANTVVKFKFSAGGITREKELKIVGICRDYQGDIYLSDDVYCELCAYQKGTNPILDINLEGVGLYSRKKIMKQLYNLGYALAPIDNMPGAYLEFVVGKGEMICKVDYEGLSSLYPDHIEMDNPEGGGKFFIVSGMKYGTIEGEYVYMTSSVVRQIALDSSYYTSQGNISPYYLYSDYYNSNDLSCITSSDAGNSLLEIIDSLYKFFLAVAVVLSIGFIILKEFRQSSSITKLSMLGVRNKDLLKLNLLTYIPMGIVIGILSIVLSYVMINVINNMFSYTFENILLQAKTGEALLDANGHFYVITTTIHRIRLMFTYSTYLTTIISTVSILIVTLLGSIYVTLRSRK